MKRLLLPICTFLLLVTMLAFTLPASASPQATITVDGTGDMVVNNGICSLREAVRNANNNDQSGSIDCAAGIGNDTIQFNLPPTATIGLFGTHILIEDVMSGTLTIEGGGQSIDATGNSHIFTIRGNGAVTVTQLTLKNGVNAVAGGAIATQSSLTLDQVLFRNNHADMGGALAGDGPYVSVRIKDSVFERNSADSNGGAITFDSIDFTASGTTFRDNFAVGNGGAIDFNSSSGTLDSTVFERNAATGGGGAMYVYNVSDLTTQNGTQFLFNEASGEAGALWVGESTAELGATTLRGNQAISNTNGGAIFGDSDSYVTLLDRSVVEGNSAEFGGGIYSENQLTIEQSRILSNTAQQRGAGIAVFGGDLTVRQGTFAYNQSALSGGGIYFVDTTGNDEMKVSHSAFISNTAYSGAGIYSGATTVSEISNSTFALNVAELGSAVRNVSASTVEMTNVTVYENRDNGSFPFTPAAVAAEIGDIQLENSIVAGNTPTDCDGIINTGGTPNIDSDGTCNATLTGVDPQLGTLISDGDLPPFFLPDATGPAVDAGSTTVCIQAPVDNRDQRGLTRPQDGNGNAADGDVCDIGAIERQSATVPTAITLGVHQLGTQHSLTPVVGVALLGFFTVWAIVQREDRFRIASIVG